ncbi:MAG: hypothetical protein U0X91_09660 [Spirosomataceae bacterium]
MKKRIAWIGVIGLVLSGCHTNIDTDTAPPGAPVFNGEGYRPIYASQTEMRQVSTEAPQALRKPGKIYVRGNYLFINEQGKGLHLIDNADPRAPRKLSFIKIPGNVDIAVKGNLMYADNGRDFVVLDITDPTRIQLVKRIENAFPIQSFPPYIQTYFECADESKGVVVGWEKVKMNRPKCYR